MYLGIDGGGTKTAFVVCDEQMAVIYHQEKGPSAIRSIPFDMAIDTLSEGILEAFENHPNIQAIYMGLGDVSGPEDEKRILAALIPRIRPYSPRIGISNDVMIAHAGGLEGAYGMVLISGTGAVAFGVDAQQALRVGGISYQEGDEGSGYYCGQMALKALAKAEDGRIEPSPMTLALKKDLEIHTLFDLATLFDNMHTNRQETARFAFYVTKYAALNDSHASKIVDDAVSHLVELIKPLNQRLELAQKELALVGSLAQEESIFRPKLIKAVHQLDPSIQVFNAKKNPAFGACILAKNL